MNLQSSINSNIKFRPCTPKDVELAVPLIYSSGPDAFNYVFNNGRYTAIDFLKSAFVTKGGEFSFDNHIAMLVEEKLIGVGSAFSGSKATSFTIHDACKIIKLYKFGAVKVMSRGLRVEQIIKLPKKNELALAHIAIHEDMRSKGFGQAMMQYLMSHMKRKENNYFILDVSELNPRAKALYERLDFEDLKLNASNLSNKYGTVANHFRMVKK